MNMFINEPLVVERRPTLSILDRACQATLCAGKPQLHFKLKYRFYNVDVYHLNSCVNMIISDFPVSVSVLVTQKFCSSSYVSRVLAHSTEDRDHILQCPSPPRHTWRLSLLTAVEEYCIVEHTLYPLQVLLLDVLRGWLFPNTVPKFPPKPEQYPTIITEIIATQERIGWRQLFSGRFSDEGSEEQGAYYFHRREEVPVQKKTGLKWQTGLITVLWTHWYSLWKLRNEDIHGKDEASRAVAERRETTRQLNQIYHLRNHTEPSAQELLHNDIRDHLQQPPSMIRNWLSIHSSLFRQSIKRARSRAIQGTVSIRNYFGATE